MGRLTTHILDTRDGCPAAGVAIRLFAVATDRQPLRAATTNDDGRTDQPLLEGQDFGAGTYEIEFDIGDYFRQRGAVSDGPAFLDTVVIRCTLQADEHYHVPLLCSPWSYSTYRGS